MEDHDGPLISGVALPIEYLLQDVDGYQDFAPDAALLFERCKLWGIRVGVIGGNAAGVLQVDGVTFVQVNENTREEAALSQLAREWGVEPPSIAVLLGSHLPPLPEAWKAISFKAGQELSLTDRPPDGAPAAVVGHLAEVPKAIALLNCQSQSENILIVGYCMRRDREAGFLKRDIFPLLPNQGLSFVPVELGRPLANQLRGVDILLHRAMDELQAVEWTAFKDSDGGPHFQVIVGGRDGSDRPLGWLYEGPEWRKQFANSQGQEELERVASGLPGLCVIDPFEKVQLLLDRPATFAALKGLEGASTLMKVRLPLTVVVASLDLETVGAAMSSAGMSLPCIVKPRIASSIAGAHSMAVVLKPEGFAQLAGRLSTPAVLQEYIDHDSVQHKCYCLGSRTFSRTRISTPNAVDLAVREGDLAAAPAAVIFDSLRAPLKGAPSRRYSRRYSRSASMPKPSHLARPDFAAENAGEVLCEGDELETTLLEPTVQWLKERLGLHLFGFDLLEQEMTGDLVLVDVNYFPSFKDIPDEEAATAVWTALQEAHEEHLERTDGNSGRTIR